ncbi:uncharacterized protein LOC126570118 [Anopheles aquasalis]|uniref:uncharacterized protein LOC126570118 n=1 Tax=Anopheles aquasalis TaxID=42839 RepID=UPI00215A7118|nr:uncharacterized protein LOC126570118 [Anopheles aquasalis]
MNARRMLVLGLVVVLIVASVCEARRRFPLRRRGPSRKTLKQLYYESRETNTPNFVRLVLMRLIYGIATQMGVEERLDNVFGGAFVPPNAADEGSDFFDVLSDESGEDFSFGL